MFSAKQCEAPPRPFERPGYSPNELKEKLAGWWEPDIYSLQIGTPRTVSEKFRRALTAAGLDAEQFASDYSRWWQYQADARREAAIGPYQPDAENPVARLSAARDQEIADCFHVNEHILYSHRHGYYRQAMPALLDALERAGVDSSKFARDYNAWIARKNGA